MSKVSMGKVLLRNVIRHTDAHNKVWTFMNHFYFRFMSPEIYHEINHGMIKLLTVDSRGVWDVEIEGSWTTNHFHSFPKEQVMTDRRHNICLLLLISFFLFSDMCISHVGAACIVTAIWTTLRGQCETALETGEMWCPREMRGRHDTGRENYMSLKPMILTGIATWFGSHGVLMILYVWNIEQEAFPVTQSYVSSGGATVALRSFIQRNFILMGKKKLSFHLMNV